MKRISSTSCPVNSNGASSIPRERREAEKKGRRGDGREGGREGGGGWPLSRDPSRVSFLPLSPSLKHIHLNAQQRKQMRSFFPFVCHPCPTPPPRPPPFPHPSSHPHVSLSTALQTQTRTFPLLFPNKTHTDITVVHFLFQTITVWTFFVQRLRSTCKRARASTLGVPSTRWW
jgi:hypothetical protein